MPRQAKMRFTNLRFSMANGREGLWSKLNLSPDAKPSKSSWRYLFIRAPSKRMRSYNDWTRNAAWRFLISLFWDDIVALGLK